MKLRPFLDTWTGVQAENRTHRLTNLILAVVCLVTVFGWLSRHETVVIQPPHLSKEARIAYDNANDEVKVQWGLYTAQMLGNVTPSTAGFLREALAPMLSPAIYQQVMSAVDTQLKQVKEEQIAIHFSPTSAVFNPSRERVIVTGELSTTGVRGETAHEQRTYEFAIGILNYRVIVEDIRIYKGSPQMAGSGDNS